MQIINKTKNTIIADEVIISDTLFGRMIGLLKHKELKKGQAMVIKPCNSIHTFFMRFPIDVIFLDKEGRVIKIISQFKPWRLSGIYFSAQACLELPSGTLSISNTTEGDLLTFS